MRKIGLIISSLVLAASATVGLAQEGGRFCHMQSGGVGLMHEMHQLNLTPDQITSIKQLFENSKTQLQPQYQALKQQRENFAKAVPGSAEYQAAADSLAQASSAIATARVQQEASLRTQIYALLTNDQKAQLTTLTAQRQARMAQWRSQAPKTLGEQPTSDTGPGKN